MKPITGTNVTLKMVKADKTFELKEVTGGGVSLVAIDSTPLKLPDTAAGSFGNATKRPGKKVSVDPFQVTAFFDPENDPRPLLGLVDTFVVQRPKEDGETEGGSESFEGFIREVASPKYGQDEDVMISFTIEVTGAIHPSAAKKA